MGGFLLKLIKSQIPTPLLRKEGQSLESYAQDFREYNLETSKGLALARGISQKKLVLSGVDCYEFKPNTNNSTSAIVYLHGGGYVSGDFVTHRSVVSHISKKLQLPVYLIDYRKAPENPYPAALNDTMTCFSELAGNGGLSAKDIILMGDSAGGGLAVACSLKLREQQKTPPKALILLSPWLDLSNSCSTIIKKDGSTILLNKKLLDDFAECYIAGADPKNPYISPLFADLEKIPAVFIQGGDMEVLLGDFLTFADRCKKASVPCELDIWEGCFHVFQILIGIPFIGKRIKEVKGAFNNIKKFVNTL